MLKFKPVRSDSVFFFSLPAGEVFILVEELPLLEDRLGSEGGPRYPCNMEEKHNVHTSLGAMHVHRCALPKEDTFKTRGKNSFWWRKAHGVEITLMIKLMFKGEINFYSKQQSGTLHFCFSSELLLILP